MKFKNKNGITLIALVVTIVVLLILAGISISILTGQNGILTRTKEAKEKTETASEDEQRKLAQAEALMSTGKTTYKGLTLPEGFAPTKIEGEDSIDDGLVITDGYGNEYVWIEVPRTETVYPTATINITEFDENAYTKIENDLHTYTEAYRNNTNYNDVYANDTATGWFNDADEYNEAKQKMLKSVYQNEGFWVGRYEAGIEVNRIDSGTATTIPLSKENLYPYTYVTRTQAKVLAEQVKSGSYTSSLMFGVQWDLVLKFIEEKTIEKSDNKELTKEEIQKKLNLDSVNIGNYNNNKWDITNSNAKYSENDGINFTEGKKKKTENKKILLSTGASEEFSLINIYDVAGNIWEWTLENTSNERYPCTFRGGSYGINGSDYPASARYSGYSVTNSAKNVGFRISLY